MIHFLYALSVVLIPLTYGTKLALGFPDVTWVDPTLILACLLWLVLRPRPAPTVTVILLLVAVISAVVGFYWKAVPGSTGTALYDTFREVTRLGLNIVWFWISLTLLRRDRGFVISWLGVAVSVQLLLAVVLWFGAVNLFSLPHPIGSYLRTYALRQAVWLFGIPIPRFAGTFIESPPFGLFMFASFIVFALAYVREGMRGRWLMIGLMSSLVGSLASLANQVLLALVLFVSLGLGGHIRGTRRALMVLTSVVLLVSVTPYLWYSFLPKARELSWQGSAVYGASVGERAFHFRYSINHLAEKPELLLSGAGPGRYGHYAVETGIFPDTVTPQFTVIEWLFEYGVLGLTLLSLWLILVARKAWHAYGIAGLVAVISLILANMFQANWKWEAWFLALAFLYTGGRSRRGSRWPCLPTPLERSG